MAIRSRNKISTEFSSSSMSDMVFLLLIFFIVLSTFVNPYGQNVKLPKGKTRVKTPKHVTVTITADKQFQLNGDPIMVGDIERHLIGLLHDKENPSIILKADEMVPHGIVVSIMEIASRNNYNIVIATKP